MLGEFTDWAEDWQDDLKTLEADIELERLDISGVYARVQDFVNDAQVMVNVARRHDETIEEELADQGVGDTLARRVEAVTRELEWTDPDSSILQDLRDAIRGYYSNDHQPDLIV